MCVIIISIVYVGLRTLQRKRSELSRWGKRPTLSLAAEFFLWGSVGPGLPPGLRLTGVCPHAAPERDPVTFWYDVTVLVKMAFKELEEVDPRLLNHMRLLYSMVGGGTESPVGAPFQGRRPRADTGGDTGWEPRVAEGPAGDPGMAGSGPNVNS